ncbi:MAG: 4Fe-4S dicluster domain-containing protein [Epsilonproteobacteria bacterium]|nr:4Fe-4S dicluster domain-containing protein [Campylobacterota bacterium]
MALEYRMEGERFRFDRLACLRSAHFHNSCQACVDLCPEGAFFLDRGRLSLRLEACSGCGVCVGGCPSEALELPFFDPNAYVAKWKGVEEVELSCKRDIPCLSLFRPQHFAALLLESQEVACDLSHCEACPLNPEGATLQSIRGRIQEAERFVAALGIERRMKERAYQPQPSRRRFFKAIFEKVTPQECPPREEGIPPSTTLLKEWVRSHLPHLPKKRLPTTFSFLASWAIDERRCDNCGECIQFCPTQALVSAKDGRAIWFVDGACIGCGICSQVCKSDALGPQEEVDLVAWAHNRGRELVEHTIAICRECKTPFAFKGDPICARCKGFVEEFGDIFKLAREES